MLRVAVLIASLLAADVTVAAAQTPTRIRGTIESATEQTLTIKSRDGQTVTVTLAPNFAVVAVSKASLGDIKSGSFVGAAALPQPDGVFKAQEVVVFPEAMRGSNEGHYPWDLSPGSTMTNAAVSAMVTGNDGTALTLKHKDGEVKVVVPQDAPIVTFGPGDKSLLVPGAGVFVPAARAADGSLSAGRVLVGKDGLMPPM
jgi:Domain of unknown function (DUF5666)